MLHSKSKLINFINYSVLVVGALVSIIPLLLVLINSFKANGEITENPIGLPISYNFYNYVSAWQGANFTSGFINGTLLMFVAIVVNLSLSAPASYVLARKKVRGWQGISLYFLTITTVPMQLFLFPLYFIFAKLHALNNVFTLGFILAVLNIPFSVFLLRTYFLSIPVTLEEAGQLDGANNKQIFTTIVLPIIKPGLLTVSIIVGLNVWNEYLFSSTFLQSKDSQTATLGFLSLRGGLGSEDLGVMLAGAVIIIVPIMIFFLWLQKYFVSGMMGGAVKE